MEIRSTKVVMTITPLLAKVAPFARRTGSKAGKKNVFKKKRVNTFCEKRSIFVNTNEKQPPFALLLRNVSLGCGAAS